MKGLVVVLAAVAFASGAVLPEHVQNDGDIPDTLSQEIEDDATSRKLHHGVAFISGLGFVSHHSPMWVALKDLDSEELAAFIAEWHSLHDEAVVEGQQEQGIEEIRRQEWHSPYGELVPGIGFVSYQNPLWSIISKLNSEELESLVLYLHDHHEHSREVTADQVKLVEENIDEAVNVAFRRISSNR